MKKQFRIFTKFIIKYFFNKKVSTLTKKKYRIKGIAEAGEQGGRRITTCLPRLSDLAPSLNKTKIKLSKII